MQIIVPSQPTKDVLTKFFDDNRAKVKGKIVMVGAPAVVPVTILTPQKRREDNDVRAQYDPVNPTAAELRRRRRTAGAAESERRARPHRSPSSSISSWSRAGAVGRINDAGREHGQIRAFNNRTFDVAKAVPTVVMRNEDYGRISRMLADGTPGRSSS